MPQIFQRNMRDVLSVSLSTGIAGAMPKAYHSEGVYAWDLKIGNESMHATACLRHILSAGFSTYLHGSRTQCKRFATQAEPIYTTPRHYVEGLPPRGSLWKRLLNMIWKRATALDFEKDIRGTQASQPICKDHRRYVKGLQPQQKSLHKISGCF